APVFPRILRLTSPSALPFRLWSAQDALPDCLPCSESGPHTQAISKYNRRRRKYATMSPAESGQRGANVRFPPPLVFVAFILIGAALAYAARLPVPGPRYLSVAAGVAIVLGGVWLIADALKLFRCPGQGPAPLEA